MQLVRPVVRFNTNLNIIELHFFNEQAFTFQLQHYSKFYLILLIYDIFY